MRAHSAKTQSELSLQVLLLFVIVTESSYSSYGTIIADITVKSIVGVMLRLQCRIQRGRQTITEVKVTYEIVRTCVTQCRAWLHVK